MAAIVAHPGVTLLMAGNERGQYVGMLSLVLIPLPSGVRARIEDVGFQPAARGSGVADALTAEAIRRARAAGARDIDLTSRPHREAALRLYGRHGVQQRDTSVLRLDLR